MPEMPQLAEPGKPDFETGIRRLMCSREFYQQDLLCRLRSVMQRECKKLPNEQKQTKELSIIRMNSCDTGFESPSTEPF